MTWWHFQVLRAVVRREYEERSCVLYSVQQGPLWAVGSKSTVSASKIKEHFCSCYSLPQITHQLKNIFGLSPENNNIPHDKSCLRRYVNVYWRWKALTATAPWAVKVLWELGSITEGVCWTGGSEESDNDSVLTSKLSGKYVGEVSQEFLVQILRCPTQFS